MKNKVLPIVLAVLLLLGAQPAMAKSDYEYTPVIPRISGHKFNTDDRGLEKYVPESRAYPKVIREDYYFKNTTGRVIPRGEDEVFAVSAGFAQDSLSLSNEADAIKNALRASQNEANSFDENEDDFSNQLPGAYPLEEIGESGNIFNGIIAKNNLINSIDEVNNIKVNGALPQLEGLSRASFVNSLNEKIRQSYTSLINAGYRSIETDYDVYSWANMTSIIIRYNIGGEKSLSKKQVVRTFVFDDISQSEVTLRNLLGKDYIAYVNKSISGEIDQSTVGAYYTGANKFNSIKPNQSFYIKDGVIHILFDEYAIAPSATGIPEFEIPMESLTFTLSRREYAEKNGIVYIPITTAMRLGMKVEIRQGGIMEITSHDGKKITLIDVNNDRVNPSDVMLINGYDIGLALEYFSEELEINVERKEGSSEIEISYMF